MCQQNLNVEEKTNIEILFFTAKLLLFSLVVLTSITGLNMYTYLNAWWFVSFERVENKPFHTRGSEKVNILNSNKCRPFTYLNT